jgi:hypothetical protein
LATPNQTCTSLRCTGQCPMLGLAHAANWLLSGKVGGAAVIIHRTVQCGPDCPVWQLRPRQRSAAQSADDTWTSPTVTRSHRTVRCAIGPMAATVGFARKARKSRTVHCPVHPRTEGKNDLPNGVQTTPNCLGAIKRTPRHMEQNTKQPLNILRRRDLAFTHLIHCDKDSSTSLSCNSVVLLSCARFCLVCMLLLQLLLLCVLLSPLTLVLIRDHLCKA